MASSSPSPTHHADPAVTSSWHAYELGDETIVVHERETPFHEAYRVTGTTRNVRALGSVDAVIYDGAVHDILLEHGRITLQHHMAGVRTRLDPTEWFDHPVVTLHELEHADLTEGIDG